MNFPVTHGCFVPFPRSVKVSCAFVWSISFVKTSCRSVFPFSLSSSLASPKVPRDPNAKFVFYGILLLDLENLPHHSHKFLLSFDQALKAFLLWQLKQAIVLGMLCNGYQIIFSHLSQRLPSVFTIWPLHFHWKSLLIRIQSVVCQWVHKACSAILFSILLLSAFVILS